MYREKKINFIAEKVGKEELLAAVAEEAAELAQAALKLRRAYDGRNYTQNIDYMCLKNMAEEMADLELCIEVLKNALPSEQAIFLNNRKPAIKNKKLDRWVERLELNSK